MTRRTQDCRFILCILISILGASPPSLGWQQKPDKQKTEQRKSEPAVTSETVNGDGNSNHEKADREKIEREKAEQERQTLLRERALFIADSMLESNDLNDKLEDASMKAAVASLVCACGRPDRAVEVVRKSLGEAFRDAMTKQGEKESTGEKSQMKERTLPEALLVRVAEAATKCDPASRKLIENDLARMRATAEQSAGKDSGAEPPVVEDDLWGTRPSIRRAAAAELLARAALNEITAGKQDDALRLLSQSANYCVVNPFIVGLARMQRDRPANIRALYLQAERQVQSLPSGEEAGALSFGLSFITGTSQYHGAALQMAQKGPDLDASTAEIVGGFLDAISALVAGKDAGLVAKSVDSIRMVTDQVPLYQAFRPDSLPLVQVWIGKAKEGLSPFQRQIAERVPAAPLSEEDDTSRIQGIAEKSADGAQKDWAYASLASTYIDSAKFDKASEAISKISELSLRSEMKDSLAFNQVKLSVSKAEDYRELGHLIERISSIPLRARSYIQMANASYKKDQEYASECLQEAVSLMGKLALSPVQSHLLLDIASTYANYDRARSMEVLSQAVKSINGHYDQPPSRWQVEYVSTTRVKYDEATFTLGRTVVDDPEVYNTKPYDFAAFRKVAMGDFDGGLLAALSLGDKSLVASAKYELCAGVLLQKPTPKRVVRPGSEVPPPPGPKPQGGADK
jgi:hypothetical protein